MSGINIKNSIYPEEKEEFSWDKNAVKEFKNLIRDQGIKCCTYDIFLLGILRARKYDLQRSLQLLKKYYEIRVSYSQYFKDLVPSKMGNATDANLMQFLPKTDQNGRYIYIFRFCNWDTSVVSTADMIRMTMLVLDFQLNFHRTQEKKIVCIIDASGISLSHFFNLSPRLINTMANFFLKDSYAIRYEAIHYVNLHIIIKAILTVLLPLLPEKLRKRSHFHYDMATLHEFINPDCLPLEYGGNLPSFDPTEFNKMLKANEEFFRKNEEYVKIYEEQKNKNFTEGRFKYIGEDLEEEKTKKFIEKSEEKFQCYSENPEAFLASLKEDSEFEITHF